MADKFIMKYSCLGILYFLIVCIRLILFLVTHQIVNQLALRFLGAFFHYGPIGLFHLTITEHLIQSGQCLARFGEQDRSADRAVDPVYDAQKDGSGLAVADADHLLDFVLESRIARRIGLDQLAGALVHDDQMVVFV